MLIFGKSSSPVDIRDIVSPFLFFSKKTCLPQLLVCIPPYSNIDQYESFSGEDEQIQITLTFLMLVYIKWRPYELLWKTIWCILGYTFWVSRGLILSLSRALPEPAEVKLLCYFVRKVVGVTVFVSDSLFWCWLGRSKNDKKLTSPDLDANIYYSFSKVAL